MLTLAIAAAILAGVDLAISHARMKKYGSYVEMNPVASYMAKQYGPRGGTFTLGALNATILLGILTLASRDLLAILVGAKLGLLAMQLKSYHIESLVERKLAEILARKKSNVQSKPPE